MSLNFLAVIVTVNIASGIAAAQLNEFGEQTHLQLLFNYEDMLQLRTNEVAGTMDAFAVLDRMIEGTGITYQYANRRTVILKAPPPKVSSFDADDLTSILIRDDCSFGLVPSDIAAEQLGSLIGACWCCVSYEHSTGLLTEASCIPLQSPETCSAYDSPRAKNFWSNAVIDEVVITNAVKP